MDSLALAINRAHAARFQSNKQDNLAQNPELKRLKERVTELEARVATLMNASPPQAPSAEQEVADRVPTMADIRAAVARFYGFSNADIVSSRRGMAIVLPRQIAMFLCKRMTSRSLPEIAFHMGDRDHTTIMHGIRKIELLRKTDRELADEIRFIEDLIRA